ncbi:MAG: hypothetical protein WCA30_18645 [Dermatophilaceae bacterium]
MALHCPAVIVVIALADEGAAADIEKSVAELLTAENVAAVYSTDGRVADVTAVWLAKRLGVGPPVRIVPGAGASQTIADVHRGETVVVLDRAPVGGPSGRWVRTGHRPASGDRAHDDRGTARARLAPGVLDVLRLEVGDEGTRVLTPHRR